MGARRPTRFRPPAFFAFGRARHDGVLVDVRQPERSAWRCVRPAAWPWRADRGGRARGDARSARRAARGRRRAARRARFRRQGRPSRRSARTCCARSRRGSRSSRSSTTRWSRCSARTRPSSNLGVTPPAVIMMVGLQGSGKTTTTAKIAKRLTRQARAQEGADGVARRQSPERAGAAGGARRRRPRSRRCRSCRASSRSISPAARCRRRSCRAMTS